MRVLDVHAITLGVLFNMVENIRYFRIIAFGTTCTALMKSKSPFFVNLPKEVVW